MKLILTLMVSKFYTIMQSTEDLLTRFFYKKWFCRNFGQTFYPLEQGKVILFLRLSYKALLLTLLPIVLTHSDQLLPTKYLWKILTDFLVQMKLNAHVFIIFASVTNIYCFSKRPMLTSIDNFLFSVNSFLGTPEDDENWK